MKKYACINCRCFKETPQEEKFGRCGCLCMDYGVAIINDFDSYYGCFNNYLIRINSEEPHYG